eukprot:scaffold135600_cov25-Prasinocladus_malaysianus.AAC.1
MRRARAPAPEPPQTLTVPWEQMKQVAGWLGLRGCPRRLRGGSPASWGAPLGISNHPMHHRQGKARSLSRPPSLSYMRPKTRRMTRKVSSQASARSIPA